MSLPASLKHWLFRWAPDDLLPIVLTQRRIFIVPARAGDNDIKQFTHDIGLKAA